MCLKGHFSVSGLFRSLQSFLSCQQKINPQDSLHCAAGVQGSCPSKAQPSWSLRTCWAVLLCCPHFSVTLKNLNRTVSSRATQTQRVPRWRAQTGGRGEGMPNVCQPFLFILVGVGEVRRESDSAELREFTWKSLTQEQKSFYYFCPYYSFVFPLLKLSYLSV